MCGGESGGYRSDEIEALLWARVLTLDVLRSVMLLEGSVRCDEIHRAQTRCDQIVL